MSERLHAALAEQLRRVGLTSPSAPSDDRAWQDLLLLISARYAQLDAEAEGRSRRDPLTGLPNRAALFEMLWLALMRADRDVAVLFVDLDGFKGINDTMGHATGDALLVKVARLLEDSVRPGDVVARIGGDEFVLLCCDCDGDLAEGVAGRIVAALEDPVDLGTVELYMTASIGIAVADGRSSPADLVQNADTALYEAKNRGRAQYVRFDQEMRAELRHQVLVENALPKAIADGQLQLWFQPVVRMSTRDVVGFEGLVRWDRPGFGLVRPAEFVPVAERSRLGAALDTWVLDESCRAAAEWPDTSLSVSVNASSRWLAGPDLVEQVGTILRLTGLDAGRLVIEMTERTLLSEDAGLAANLLRLREIGVRLAVDDFGTGYSSLAYLRRLPVSVLKIDRSFVADVDTDPTSSAIVGAVVTMARALDLDVVVEGVERPGQARHLRTLGCDLAQGFLYWTPVPAEEVAAVVAAGRIPTPR
jgi:diguanylate cyclase (GGDEF)-like protein